MKKELLISIILGTVIGFFVVKAVPLLMQEQDSMEKNIYGYTYIGSLDQAIALFPKTITALKEHSQKSRECALSILQTIIDCPDHKQTKETMLRAYDRAYAAVVSDGILFPVKSLYQDSEMQKVAEEEALATSVFTTEHFECNQALYDAFNRYLLGNAQREVFTKEEKHFLKKLMDNFKLAGMHLPLDQRTEVMRLKNECAELALKFETIIDADVSKILVAEDALQGVPEQFKETLTIENDHYVLFMDYPTRDMILKYCSVEATRKEYYKAFNNRAYPENEAVLKNLQLKRHELARALGFENYAAYNLYDLMAKDPQVAWNFENDLQQKIVKKVQEEFDFLVQHLPENISLRADGKLNPWDISYVAEAIKKEYYAINELEFAEYFPLKNTLQHLFKIYESFFDLSITEVPVQGLWHKDVIALTIAKKSSNEVMGYVFMDLFPREKKYGHACHSTTLQGFVFSDGTRYPDVSVLVCNFTKPTKDQDSLLRYGEVKTFFHEFGHALHAVLGATEYVALSGTSVERDFVELPSQLLENWIEDPVILKTISSHYKTGEALSDALIEKRLRLLGFCRGIGIATQLYYGMLSLHYFGNDIHASLASVAQEIAEKNQMFVAYDSDTHFYCSFGHLSGYGAAYYGYLWSLVFADDVFEQIKKEGLLSAQAGLRYQNAIIGRGGSCDAYDMLRDYLQRDPLPDAFYKKLGL